MTAIISSCGQYRYRLEREGGGEGSTAVIMVNPSTADAETDDQTIRKLRGFGDRYGWGRIIVGNLYALRATDVRELARVNDPVGPDNDHHLRMIIGAARQVIVAWGPLAKQPSAYRGLRWRKVVNIAANIAYPIGIPLLSLGAPAADGHPCHPLMLGYDRAPQPWRAS